MSNGEQKQRQLADPGFLGNSN